MPTPPQQPLSAWRVTAGSPVVWIVRDRNGGADVIARLDERTGELTQFPGFGDVTDEEIAAVIAAMDEG